MTQKSLIIRRKLQRIPARQGWMPGRGESSRYEGQKGSAIGRVFPEAVQGGAIVLAEE